MKQFDHSKRETLEKLARAAKIAAGVAAGEQVLNPEPWERLARAAEKPSGLSLTSLEKFKTLLADCWELSNNKELEVAEVILSSFLPKITAIPSREVTADIAYVASQGLRLQSVLIHHRLQLVDKVRMCEQSVEYGRHANDINTLVETLVELAVAYKYNGQPDQWFKTLQEALYYVPQASPLVQSQTYLKSSLAFAHYKRIREAELYFQLGSDVFPNHPKHDPGYALADASIYTFSRDAGRAQLEMGHVSEAYGAFGIYTSSDLLIPERLRLEIVNAQCRAAILEGELDKYAHFLKDGLAGALALGSKKRFNEAYTTFREDMPATWLKDNEIRSIGEHYHLVRS